MLDKGPRTFDIRGDIDTPVRHEKLRKLLLQAASCPVDVEDRDHNCALFCNFLNKRNCIVKRVSLHAHEDHVRLRSFPGGGDHALISLHVLRLDRDCLRRSIPEMADSKSLLLHRGKVGVSCDQCHVFSRLCHVKSKNSSGTAGTDDDVFHDDVLLFCFFFVCVVQMTTSPGNLQAFCFCNIPAFLFL